jgi:hypothetical protein
VTGDMKRIRMMDRRNTCLHESAHSVARQLLIGDLAEVAVVKNGPSYSYPVERKPLDTMDRDELAKIAVVVAAGLFAEAELCSEVGDKERAVADDIRQWEGIRGICGFSDEEMAAFWEKTERIMRAHENVIRRMAIELDRRRKLTGEQVSRLMEKYGEASR